MLQVRFEQWVAIFSILMTSVLVVGGLAFGKTEYSSLAFAFAGPVMVVMGARRMFSHKDRYSRADRLLMTIIPFLLFGFAVNGTVASIELFGTHLWVFVPVVPAAAIIGLMIWPPVTWVLDRQL